MFLGNRLGLGRVRPLGFNPTQISNLVRWGDPTKASTINAGSPSADDPVSTSGDRSSSSNDLTQGTGTLQPLWKTTSMLFDATNDALKSSSNDFDKSTADSFSCGLWINNNTVGVQILLGKWGTAGTTKSYCIQYNSGWKAFGSTNGTGFVNTASGGTGSGSWVFLFLVYDSVADLLKLTVDGGAFVTVALSTLYDAPVDYYLSSNANATFSANGNIQQDYFYSKALTLAEINLLKEFNPPS